MTLHEAVNRTYNLVGTAVVGIAGLAFLPEIFVEDDWDDKWDDIGLAVIALLAIAWYMRGKNSLSRTLMPLFIAGAALIDKIAAVVIEFHDKEAVGDDFGALILFIALLCVLFYQYQKSAKLTENVQPR